MAGEIIEGKKHILVRGEDGTPVYRGDKVTSFRGETQTVYGGREPDGFGSSGRVFVQDENGASTEYYPSVFNLEWKELSKGKL